MDNIIIPLIISIVAGIIVDAIQRPGIQALLFKAMLRISPRDYLERFGEEMLLVFMDTCKEATESYGMFGTFTILKIFLREIVDVSKNATLLRIEIRIRNTKALLRILNSANPLQIMEGLFIRGLVFEALRKGDRVRIMRGPFEGYDAIFDTRVSGEDRVQVLLAYLNDHPIRVQIDASEIEKVRG